MQPRRPGFRNGCPAPSAPDRVPEVTTEREGQVKTEYIRELDGVRAISILLVLATHLLPVGPSDWRLNHATGLMGMSLFFCLSGFLITRFLYAAPDRISDFMSRRVARIVPLMALYGFIVAVLWHGSWASYGAALGFFLNYADPLIMKGLSHLWSLCVEMHFYVGIALAVLAFGRRAFWLVPVVALVVLGLRIEAGAYDSIRTHHRVDEILTGSLLALFWLHQDRPDLSRLKPWIGRSFWIVLPLWLLSSHETGGWLNYLRPWFAMLLVGSVICMEEGQLRATLRIAPLAYIAKISYALYVWHPMTALGWMGEGSKETLYFVKRPISFAATFLLAHLSTHTFERYFTGLAKSRSLKKPAAAQP